jgi:hypothetical protein
MLLKNHETARDEEEEDRQKERGEAARDRISTLACMKVPADTSPSKAPKHDRYQRTEQLAQSGCSIAIVLMPKRERWHRRHSPLIRLPAMSADQSRCKW